MKTDKKRITRRLTKKLLKQYEAGFPYAGTQDDIDRYNRQFNLRHGIGCPDCGGVLDEGICRDCKMVKGDN